MKMTSSRTAFMLAFTAIRHRSLPQCGDFGGEVIQVHINKKKTSSGSTSSCSDSSAAAALCDSDWEVSFPRKFKFLGCAIRLQRFCIFGLRFNMRMTIRNTNSLQSQYIAWRKGQPRNQSL
jgi:hypothetical protein